MILILGETASKANQRRLVTIKGKPRFIKSSKARQYVRDAIIQLRQQLGSNVPMYEEGDVKVTMRIYYASRRPDLDESLILDVLQGFAYKNDRQVKEKHITWGLDKENPRAEIWIAPYRPEE